MSLHLSDVVLTYPDGESRLTALDRVHLDVPAGTVAAVVGPSGSGKSSLLAVAATLITPDRGRVVVAGEDTAGRTRAELTVLRRERIGMVFQRPNLLASLSAEEQLLVAAHLAGGSPRAARGRARELLDAVGLSGRGGSRPGRLSGGQQQRVNIARALMNRPSVLLVDEPTSALDHERGSAVIELLASVTRASRIATVIVTHDRSHTDGVDSVHEMVDGRLREVTRVVAGGSGRAGSGPA